MKDQINTIRAALDMANLGIEDGVATQKALTALYQLEAMVGAQEPVAWAVYWGLPPTRQNSVHFDKESAQAVANQIKSATEVRPLYAAPVAQQPQARPDFTDEWTGYLKDGETPFERFMRERKDLDALTKLYQRALEENERLKAQQPQAKCRHCGGDGLVGFDWTCAVCNGTGKQPQAKPTDTERAYLIGFADGKQAEAVPPGYVVDRGFRWDGENQQHIPQLTIEFEPVPANGPCDAQGWKDRDAVARMFMTQGASHE